jgi:hypothetical protein
VIESWRDGGSGVLQRNPWQSPDLQQGDPGERCEPLGEILAENALYPLIIAGKVLAGPR